MQNASALTQAVNEAKNRQNGLIKSFFTPSCVKAPKSPSNSKDASAMTDLDHKTQSKLFRQILAQLKRFEDEEYDRSKLRLKKFHLFQMMNLKVKGRYLEETRFFSRMNSIMPS